MFQTAWQNAQQVFVTEDERGSSQPLPFPVIMYVERLQDIQNKKGSHTMIQFLLFAL